MLGRLCQLIPAQTFRQEVIHNKLYNSATGTIKYSYLTSSIEFQSPRWSPFSGHTMMSRWWRGRVTFPFTMVVRFHRRMLITNNCRYVIVRVFVSFVTQFFSQWQWCCIIHVEQRSFISMRFGERKFQFNIIFNGFRWFFRWFTGPYIIKFKIGLRYRWRSGFGEHLQISLCVAGWRHIYRSWYRWFDQFRIFGFIDRFGYWNDSRKGNSVGWWWWWRVNCVWSCNFFIFDTTRWCWCVYCVGSYMIGRRSW